MHMKWLCVAAVIVCSCATVYAQDVKSVIVIGWDGASRAHVESLLKRGELPNLETVVKDGGFFPIDITNGATEACPGWVQLLTGYSVAITGVADNTTTCPIPRGLTVFERAEIFFGRDRVDTIALMTKKACLENDGPAVDAGGNVIPAKTWYWASQMMDVFKNDLKESGAVTDCAIDEIVKRRHRLFLMFLQYAEPDRVGHALGEYSSQYEAAIKGNDRHLGRIVEFLKSEGLFAGTCIYVVADHGFDENGKSHMAAPYVFLATNDRQVSRGGDRLDIAPTVMKRLGMDVSMFEPRLDGVALDRMSPRAMLTKTKNRDVVVVPVK